MPTTDFVSGQCFNATTVNLTANDSDPEGNYPLQLISITRTSGFATATVVSTSSVSVNFASSAGLSTFNYIVQDSLGASATGELNVSTSCGGGGPLQ